MQEHNSKSVESLTHRIHGFPHIFHSIFRTHPGQGIYTHFNNNNDNLDVTHTQQNFIQHTSIIFQYRWLQVLSPQTPTNLQICLSFETISNHTNHK